MARFKLTGDKKIDRIFLTLPRKVQNKIVREELKKALKPIAKDAKARAPKDEGDLKRAIVERAGKRKRNVISRVVMISATKLKRDGDEKAKDRTAGSFQEYGTKHSDAQPFMRPAFSSGSGSARDMAIAGIKRRVTEEAKRA